MANSALRRESEVAEAMVRMRNRYAANFSVVSRFLDTSVSVFVQETNLISPISALATNNLYL